MMTDEQKLNEYKKIRNEFSRVYTESQKAGKLHDENVQQYLHLLNVRAAKLLG